MISLADTSILLRLSNTDDARYLVTQSALQALRARGESVVVARQNFVEFRCVAARPILVNGMGMSSEQAESELDRLEKIFPRLLELDEVYAEWRRLCRLAGVSGKQVHDTRLVAVCICSGVQTILTWNPKDFVRFLPFVPGLAVLTPDDVRAE